MPQKSSIWWVNSICRHPNLEILSWRDLAILFKFYKSTRFQFKTQRNTALIAAGLLSPTSNPSNYLCAYQSALLLSLGNLNIFLSNFPLKTIAIFMKFFIYFGSIRLGRRQNSVEKSRKQRRLHSLQVGDPQKKFIIIIFMRSNSKKEAQKAPQCTICMQRPSNSSIDGCSHEFCLRCIKRWARTKNNCPLCRERFLKIQTRNRTIQVEPIPERIRPSRPPIAMPPQVQRSIYYLPMLVYTQPNCFFYPGQQPVFMTTALTNMQQTTYPFGVPSFFLPSS